MSTAAPDPTTTARRAGGATAVRHETFVVELEMAARAEAVFGAFADTPVRRRWFKLPGQEVAYRHDFAVAGGESASSVFTTEGAEPERLAYEAHYLDIVPDTRVVYAYTSSVNEIVRWGSLVTVELDPTDRGTRLRWTEQAAFTTPSAHPEHDLPHLRGAIRLRLNGLAPALRAA